MVYVEAEKNNLDILGFVFHSRPGISRHRKNNSTKKRIIYQPELSNLMYKNTSDGGVRQFGGNLCNNFIRTDLPLFLIIKIIFRNLL